MNTNHLLLFFILFFTVALTVYFLCKKTPLKQEGRIKHCAKQMLHSITIEPENISKEIIRDSNPILIIYDDFLSEKECDFLVKKYGPQTIPSTVVSKNQGYTTNLDSRKSFSHYTEKSENEIIKAIEERASSMSGFPVSFIEPVQFLKYEKSGYFRPHHDYFSEDYTKGEYQRYATFFVYLNDDFSGGTTYFPELNTEINPKKGRAVFWFNVDENGDGNPLTLHTGTDVTGGEKYALNIWIRNKPT